MSVNIFEQASRKKLRFATNKGQLSVEELWELNLESLDNIAKAVNKDLKESQEESFIGKKTPGSTLAALKLDILKSVIEVKLAEQDRAATRAANLAKISQLEELALSKQNQSMEGMSLEEITAMLTSLKAEV